MANSGPFQLVIAIVLCVIAGIIGAGMAGGAVFIASYSICRAIAWLAQDMSYMYYMWLAIPLGVIAILVGFVAGVLLSAIVVLRKGQKDGSGTK